MKFIAKISLDIKLITIVAFALIGAAIIRMTISIAEGSFPPSYLEGFMFFLILGVALDAIGRQVIDYEVNSETLKIHKRWGTKVYRVNELLEVSPIRNPFWRSIRVFGIGGVLGFYGKFRDKGGLYFSAYVTDTKKCMMLRTRSGWIAISPSDPELFLEEIGRLVPDLVK